MIRILLVRPQGPRNVGSILRLIANFGPAELVLVNPPKPSLLLHPDFEQMSHGVEDIASRVIVVTSLAEGLANCTASFGFTARSRDHRSVEDWRAVRSDLIRSVAESRAHADQRVALVFGSEENGLTGEETLPLQRLLRFPTTDEHTSINLAMSVGIVLSSLHYEDAPAASSEGSMPLPGEARTFLIQRLRDVLGRQTTSDPARRDLEASIERVFSRTTIETRDARAWHLLARALGGEAHPADYDLASGAAGQNG